MNDSEVLREQVAYYKVRVSEYDEWFLRQGRYDHGFIGTDCHQSSTFWSKVGASLKPNGRVFLIDSLLEQASTARDHAPLNQSGLVGRRLNDGREYRIVKIFYEPASLEQQLSSLDWNG